MAALFWVSIGFVLYAYAGYPALLAVWTKMRRNRSAGPVRHADPATTSHESLNTSVPRVSVIIAARDEARRLPSRIDNILASDYPVDRIEVIVASDGSTDDTPAALAPYLGSDRLVPRA